MNTKTKKKLCWNCEGEMLLTAVQCPFCGVSVERGGMDNHPSKDHFAPPYKLVGNGKETVPSSPYSKASSDRSLEPEEAEDESFLPEISNPKNMILRLAFLLVGASLAIFGTVLWLFADKTGYLNLRWDAKYWFVYLLLSVPLLFLGWKAAAKTPDEEI